MNYLSFMIIISNTSHCFPLRAFSSKEYCSTYFVFSKLRDVSGTIGGRSGDCANVGRVTRVWVVYQVGLENFRQARMIKKNENDYLDSIGVGKVIVVVVIVVAVVVVVVNAIGHVAIFFGRVCRVFSRRWKWSFVSLC